MHRNQIINPYNKLSLGKATQYILERIKEEKDFKAILDNDEYFKEVWLLSASFSECNYELVVADINMWA